MDWFAPGWVQSDGIRVGSCISEMSQLQSAAGGEGEEEEDKGGEEWVRRVSQGQQETPAVLLRFILDTTVDKVSTTSHLCDVTKGRFRHHRRLNPKHVEELAKQQAVNRGLNTLHFLRSREFLTVNFDMVLRWNLA